MDRRALDALVNRTSQWLGRILGIDPPALRIQGDGLIATGVAGLINVAPRIELEVVPKFLDATDKTWRKDFFLVATLSKFGRLFSGDRVRSEVGDRGDLATLVARTLLAEVHQSQRWPLRLYRRRTWTDVAADGEIDPESVVSPGPDGFVQSTIALDRGNVYNASIGSAIRSLLPEVRDPATRQLLGATSPRFASSVAWPARVPLRVPNRHRRWQDAFDLSRHVIAGRGIDFETGHVQSPGFAINTVKAWENLVTLAMRLGTPTKVRAQAPYLLGWNGGRRVEVRPDIAVGPDAVPGFLADAKYKGRITKQRQRVGAADLYESLAFLEASTAKTLVLLYPRLGSTHRLDPGTCTLLDDFRVGQRRVRAFDVECRGVAQTGGLRQFAMRLSGDVMAATT